MSLRVLLGIAVLVGCEKGEEAPAPEPPPMPVEVHQVEQATLPEEARGIGSVEAALTAEIRPEVAARVVEVHFEEGGPVEEGTPLFTLAAETIEPELGAAQAALRAARARAENAKVELARSEELFRRGAAAASEVDQRRTEYRSAVAEAERLAQEVARARERVGETEIVAPWDGRISESQVDEGDYVAVGDLLATLYRGVEVGLSFTLPEGVAGRVQPGQPVTATVSALPGRTFHGEVTFVAPAIREDTRDIRVKASVHDPEGVLRPGQFASVAVVIGQREPRPVIPEGALVPTRTGYEVYVVEDGVARVRPVEIGQRSPGWVEITDGLVAGEVMVRRGHLRLSDGVRVTPTEPPEREPVTRRSP